MTWTCHKCHNENPELKAACLHCGGADKSAVLSDEERAALDMQNVFQAEIGSVALSVGDWQKMPEGARRARVAMLLFARAPLEAELTKLRERVRELEAWKKSALESIGRWNDVAEAAWKLPGAKLGAETQAFVLSVLRAQLAQAKKPAAPAGLPKVGEPVEINRHGEWITDRVQRHTFWGGKPAFEPEKFASILPLSKEGDEWRRIPPAQTSSPTYDGIRLSECHRQNTARAQTSREPMATVVPSSVENHLYMFTPSASPPGEVSMDNFDDVVWSKLQPGLVADQIRHAHRANVERETKPLRTELERLYNACHDWRVHFEEVENERDAALAEVERIKGEKP